MNGGARLFKTLDKQTLLIHTGCVLHNMYHYFCVWWKDVYKLNKGHHLMSHIRICMYELQHLKIKHANQNSFNLVANYFFTKHCKHLIYICKYIMLYIANIILSMWPVPYRLYVYIWIIELDKKQPTRVFTDNGFKSLNEIGNEVYTKVNLLCE